MTFMTNIELFDEYTARILAKLYEGFPRKQFLNAQELSGHQQVDEFGGVLDDQGSPSAHFDVAMATVEWLAEAGYIRIDAKRQTGASGAVLTAQGLLLLKSTPASLQSKEAVGERISRAIKTGALSVAKEAANAAIAAGVGMAFR